MDLSRLDILISSYDKADAIRQSLIEEKGSYLSRFSEIEEFLEHKDEITETLLDIQREMQSGTTESYEKLLTELLHMVMPDDPSNHRVVMSHYIKNSAVSLKTQIETLEGYRHDIYEDKGQSVENIMALCMRFLALGRTANRRVLFFDESDHGIMPAYMGRFSDVLYNLTYRVGMQVVYISHHDWRLFEGKARIIELARDGDAITANVISEPDNTAGAEFSSEVMDYMNGIGITDITLGNYKAHADTKVELSPFLNVIIGPMDLGKSSIINAVDSLKRNSGSNSRIRDGQRGLSVELGLEEGRRLHWAYNLDSPKKSKYLLYDADGSVMQLHEGAKVPDFLDDYLVMPLHHGYDLHIADSHDSGFIFSKHITEAKAAELLSFDEETTQAQDMLSQHKDNIIAAKKEQKQIQAMINKVKSKLAVMAYLDNVDIDQLRQARLTLRGNVQQKVEITTLLANRLGAQESRVGAMVALTKLPEFPRRQGSGDNSIEKMVDGIHASERKLAALNKMKAARDYPKKPEQVGQVSEVIGKLIPLERKLEALSRLKTIIYPDKPPANDITQEGVDKIGNAFNQLNMIKRQAKQTESEIQKISESIKSAIHHKGGVCPLCQSEV